MSKLKGVKWKPGHWGDVWVDPSIPRHGELADALREAGAEWNDIGKQWKFNDKEKAKAFTEAAGEPKKVVLPPGVKAVGKSEKDVAQEWQPGKPVTLYRATDPGDPFFGESSHYFDSLQNAKLYTDNPGFGGGKIFKATVTPAAVLDLTGESKAGLARIVADKSDPKKNPFGEFGSREEMARALDESWATYDNLYDVWENDSAASKFIKQHFQWVRHDRETYPEGATTWVSLRGLTGPGVSKA